MATAIVKVAPWQVIEGVLEAGQGEFNVNPNYRDGLPTGKVSLSFKDGKKRRLVKGRMRAVPTSDRLAGLVYRYVFKPNNLLKLRQFVPD